MSNNNNDDDSPLEPLPPQQDLEDGSKFNSTQLRNMLMARQKQQGIWESEVASAMAVLQVQKNVGMSESVIDAEGFPRDDIDVTAVRQARNTIATKRNDLKKLGEELKILLEATFAALSREQGEENSPEMQNEIRFEQKRRERAEAREKKEKEEEEKYNGINTNNNNSSVTPKITAEQKKQEELNKVWGNLNEVGVVPFAVVRDVKLNSPAFHAGLLDGDVLIAVGRDSGKEQVLSVDESIQPMLNNRDFGGLIQKSSGVPLRLIVQREDKVNKKNGKILQEIYLVPTAWSGPGILGCGVEPVQ